MDHHDFVVSVVGVQSVNMRQNSNQKSVLSSRQSPHQASPVQQLKLQSMTQRFNTIATPDRGGENQDLKQKLQNQMEINQILLGKLGQLEQIVTQKNNHLAFEIEKKCTTLTAELHKVNQALDLKNQECLHLEKQLLTASPRYTTSRTTGTPKIQSEVRNHGGDEKDKLITQLTNKLNLIAEEMSTMNVVLEAKIQENKQLKWAAQDPSRAQLIKLQQMLTVKQNELETYKQKTQQAGELSQKLQVVTQELERMNIIMLAKNEEIERCKYKILQFEEQNAEVITLQHAVQSNYKAIQSKQSQIQSFQEEISRLEFQLNYKSQIISDLQGQLEVLNHQLDEKQGEVDDLRAKNGKLRTEMSEAKVQAECYVSIKQEYERCQQYLKNKENEINHYRQEFHKSQYKLSEYQQQLLQAQETMKDFELYKINIQELQTQKLVLNEKCKNVDSLQQEVQIYLTKIKEQENNIVILDNERRRLIDLQRMKQEECDALNSALQQLTIQHGKAVEQVALAKEQYITIEQWKQRYQRLEVQYADLQRESNQKTKNFQQELEQLRLKIYAPNENAQLKDTAQMLQTQVLNLQQDIYQMTLENEKDQGQTSNSEEIELKKELEKKNFIINRLFQEIDLLKQDKQIDDEESEEINRLNREIIRQKIIINNLYVQISDLQHYGNQAKSENFNGQNNSKFKTVEKH